MVSIPGGEPLMHPQIAEIVAGLVARKKYIYLCTNALLLNERLHEFTPSKYLSFSVHMDGQREHHDFSVCREGTYDKAVEGMRLALERGFRVTTNTTLFDGANPRKRPPVFRRHDGAGRRRHDAFARLHLRQGARPGAFPQPQENAQLFRQILSNRNEKWRFNMSPLFLEFLMGKRHYKCTPWGMPTYNIFGWQKPCYLLQDGYADTFDELMRETDWERYGTESGNPKCANCMVHSGYEASAVNDTFGSLGGFLATVRATLFDKYKDPDVMGGAPTNAGSDSGRWCRSRRPRKPRRSDDNVRH